MTDVTKVLFDLGQYGDLYKPKLILDGYDIVDMDANCSPADVPRQFDESGASVLFIEPGVPSPEVLMLMRQLYTAMADRPMVFCTASPLEWWQMCQENNMTDVVVTSHTGAMPKDSFREEIDEALGKKAA